MMGSESTKLRCGARGVAEVLHLHVQGGAQLGEGNGVGEVVQEAYGGAQGLRCL